MNNEQSQLDRVKGCSFGNKYRLAYIMHTGTEKSVNYSRNV